VTTLADNHPKQIRKER